MPAQKPWNWSRYLIRSKTVFYQPFIRITVSFIMMITLLLVGQVSFQKKVHAQPAIPNNYSCGSITGSGHCYAFYNWHGDINGAQTNIDVPFLGNRGSTNGDTNWETWVAQDNVSACNDANQGGICWVEAGITDDYGALGIYFWADSRPNGGYTLHYTNQVGPDDQVEKFEIYRVDNSTWNVDGSVWSCGSGQGGTCSTTWGGQSTSNSMQPTEIQIGIELTGSYGQPAVGSNWQYNYYRCGNNWCPQSGLGNPGSGTSRSFGINQGPLNGEWATTPSSGNTGDWNAYCSC